MRYVQLVRPRTLEVCEAAPPGAPGPGEVLVRLRAVGICGSDLHWYREGRIGAVPAAYPMVLGHEAAGEIAAAGPGVEGLAAGQAVAIEPAITCGRCEFCLAGRRNHCLRSSFMGTPQRPGLFSEFAVIPAANAEPVPAEMDFAAASLIEPLAVLLHAQELARVKPGDIVAVFGAGPIGMLATAVSRLAGAASIVVEDKVADRLPLARAMGADLAVNTAAELRQAVFDLTRGRGADVVLDAAGAPETINLGLEIACFGGRFVLIAIPVERQLGLDLHPAMRKELQVLTVKRSSRNSQAATALLAAGRIRRALVTHRLKLEETPRAFEILDAYADGAGKVVIEVP